MTMPQFATDWTVDRLNAMPEDGQRYEIIDGELYVSPAPSWRHQHAVTQLAIRLAEYLRPSRLGLVLIAPADVTFSRATNVQPDVLVVPVVDGHLPANWVEAGRLLLAVEVRSPSTARTDQGVKRRLYQREQVPEYWIVDAEAQVIERWRPGEARPEILSERIEWQPEAASAPLVIELPEFFAGLTG